MPRGGREPGNSYRSVVIGIVIGLLWNVLFMMLLSIHFLAVFPLSYTIGALFGTLYHVRKHYMETDYEQCTDCSLRKICWKLRMHEIFPPKRVTKPRS
ncbi:MAG: hypothetical protein ACTSXJ_08790 [Candidatus Baldrarchaeia archaeon]